MEPLVTIGIATRNRAAFLPRAVESALAQNVELPYEVVVVDDASDDLSTLACLEAIENSKGVRVVRRDINGGEAAARNSVIEHTRGEFVLWLDDDDCLTPDALESQLRFLSANPHADVVYGNLLRSDATLQPQKEYRYKNIPEELRLHVLLFYSPYPNGGTLIRKSLFDRCGCYDETFGICPDYEFWVRAVLSGAEFCHNDHVIYLYRAHGANQALDSESDLFHEMNCRVAEKIVETVPLDRVFPMFDWKGNPKQAFSQAMAGVSAVFLRHCNFERALHYITQGERNYKGFELDAIKAIVLYRSGKNTEAWEVLQSASLQLSPFLRGILNMAGVK